MKHFGFGRKSVGLSACTQWQGTGVANVVLCHESKVSRRTVSIKHISYSALNCFRFERQRQSVGLYPCMRTVHRTQAWPTLYFYHFFFFFWKGKVTRHAVSINNKFEIAMSHFGFERQSVGPSTVVHPVPEDSAWPTLCCLVRSKVPGSVHNKPFLKRHELLGFERQSISLSAWTRCTRSWSGQHYVVSWGQIVPDTQYP